MPERPFLSKAEMEVARVVWDLKKATVREVFDVIGKKRKIGFFTVQTYLRRLEAKGYLHVQRQGRAMVYRALVPAKTVIRKTVEDLIDRLFGGEGMPLVHYLVRDRAMTAEETAQLRELLRQLEAERNESRPP